MRSVSALTGTRLDDERARHFEEVKRRSLSTTARGEGEEGSLVERAGSSIGGVYTLPTSAPPPPAGTGADKA